MLRLIPVVAFISALPAALSAQTTQFASRQLADFNGDGFADVVTENGVQIGDGNGGFVAGVFQNASRFPPGLGDLNGDGITDLVYDGAVHLGDGAGNFGAAIAFTPTPMMAGGSRPFRTPFHVADFDGDGNNDVCHGFQYDFGFGYGFTLVSINFGDGTGNLGPGVDTFLTRFVEAVRIGDLNDDGAPDVVLASNFTFVEVWMNDGTGSLTPGPVFQHQNFFTTELEIIDLDGDGRRDVVFSSTGFLFSAQIDAHLQTAPGQFTVQSSSSTLSSGMFATRFADVDGNGTIDAVANLERVGIRMFPGNGDGTFGTESALPGAPTSGVVGLLHDLNLDGTIDLLIDDLTFVANTTTPTPVGIARFGTGSAGCEGRHTLSANSAPTVGNANFAIVANNVPPHVLAGVCWLGDRASMAGSPLADLLLHIDLSTTMFLHPLELPNTDVPTTAVELPIPASASGLIGMSVFAQMAWVVPDGSRCKPSMFGASTSPGLEITIQP